MYLPKQTDDPIFGCHFDLGKKFYPADVVKKPSSTGKGYRQIQICNYVDDIIRNLTQSKGWEITTNRPVCGLDVLKMPDNHPESSFCLEYFEYNYKEQLIILIPSTIFAVREMIHLPLG